MARRYVVGSEDLMQGHVKDRIGDSTVLLDLTGATLVVRAKNPDGTTRKDFSAVAGNQTTDIGSYSYQITATDFDEIGKWTLQMRITAAGKTRIAPEVDAIVLPATAAP